MKKFESVGGVIVNEFNEVVLVLNPSPAWQFPKGSVEEGESKVETAKREIKEECGLEVGEPLRELPSYTRESSHNGNPFYEGKRVMRAIYHFLFRVKKQDLKPGMEINECKWVPISNVEESLSYGDDKKFFRSIREEINKL